MFSFSNSKLSSSSWSSSISKMVQDDKEDDHKVGLGMKLMEVCLIRYLSYDRLTPEEQCGTISLVSDAGVQYLYTGQNTETRKPLISAGDEIIPTVKGPTSSFKNLRIEFDLFDGAYKGFIPLEADSRKVVSNGAVNVYDKTIKSQDRTGQISVLLGFYDRAIIARLEDQDEGDHDAKRDVDLQIERMLRNRDIDSFINDWTLLDMHFYSPLTKEIGLIYTWTTRWKLPFYNCVDAINKSTSFEKWVQAIHNLEVLIEEDFRLATCLSGKITRGLVKILKGSEYQPDLKNVVQRPIISIISHARFEVCEDVMENQVVPILVEFVANGNVEVSNKAMLALVRLSYVFPGRYKLFLDKGALDAAFKVFRDFRHAHENMSSLAMFLVAVCRDYSSAQPCDAVTSKEVEKEVLILEDLFQDHAHCFGSTGVYICYALSYLTYGRCVALKEKTFDRLITLFSEDCCSSDFYTFLAGSALGVVGNIVRWGNLEQIKILNLDNWLLESLVGMLLVKYKKFRKEACHIISNMAARSGTLVEELIEADLMAPLCKLLEGDKSDMKLEAAWAIFNGICGPTKFGEIDLYPGTETVGN